MWHLLAILVVSLGSYWGTRKLFPSYSCNGDVQDFVLNDVPIYWKVIEGPCRPNDPDYSQVEFNVEELLVDEEGEWPEAVCQYGEIFETKYIFTYGTDKEKVDTIDCYAPLEEIKDEMLSDPAALLRGLFS